MERVVGIGGVQMRARDPNALARWYRESLGINTYADDVPEPERVWFQEAGPTVFSPAPADTEYFGRNQQVMLNLRVRDLDAMVEQLRGLGTTMVDEIQAMDEVGRFQWIEDPEGNRIELWEPAPEAMEKPGN
jgi:predicted enzyme related to lactoylglutathione lyase